MPILNVPHEAELELTHECDWNCRYCAVNTHSLPPVDAADALRRVERAAAERSIVTFSGGEPGLLERRDVEKMLDAVEHTGSVPCLNTNGLFLRRYPDLAPRFAEIDYHCSRDLGADETFDRYPDLDNIRYMLVVDDENLPRLGAFLDRNSDVVFDVVPASYEDGDARRPLSARGRMEIVRRFSGRITFESQRRLFVDKDFDKVKYF